MNNQTQTTGNDLGTLGDDARALVTATADVAWEKVGDARQRVNVALERGKKFCGHVREQAVEGAKVADEAVHEHPYKAIALGVGVGTLLGYLLGRGFSHNGD